MESGKQKILGLENEIVGILQGNQGSPRARIEHVHTLLWNAIETAKTEKDGLTQLYGCMVEAAMHDFIGDREELITKIKTLTQTDKSFMLAKDLGAKPPANGMLIDADTYGLYYALNDHYSQRWSPREYKLAKNGAAGNPLITNLFRLFYENEAGEPVYTISDEGYVEAKQTRNGRTTNPMRGALLDAFKTHNTHIFADMSLAYVGGGSLTYHEVVEPLLKQMPASQFHNFSPSPYSGGVELTMKSAGNGGQVDYVVSSNVLNAMSHHLKPEKRDEVFAASAKLLKKGGKAIHLMEKTSQQTAFNVCLNRTMHKALGQELVYSFFREKSPMDYSVENAITKSSDHILEELGMPSAQLGGKHISAHELIHLMGHGHSFATMEEHRLTSLKSQVVDGKPDDFRTTMLVLNQSEKKVINEQTVATVKQQLNHYHHRFNYHHKPVYVEKPGLQLE